MKLFIQPLQIFLLSMVITAAPVTASIASDNHPAVTLVMETTKKIFSAIIENRDNINKDASILHKLVNDIVLTHFNFEKMSALVLRNNWESANTKQKQEFAEQFRLLIIRTYANALVDNTDQEIKYLPPRENSKKDKIIVRTEIEQKGSFPLPISYKLYLNKDSCKVYDVNIDGISLVTNYKSSFANELRKGSIDDLINTLAKRNQETKPK